MAPKHFRIDTLYRRQALAALGVSGTVSPDEALARAATRRALCLTPFADSTIVSGSPWIVSRLVRVTGVVTTTTSGALSVTELLRVAQQQSSPWTREVEAVYLEAARRNVRLCGGLLAYLGDPAASTCGP